MRRIGTRVAWQFLGTAFYSGATWLTVSVLTKLSTPEIVGAYTLSLAVLAPIFAFTNSQLQAVVASDIDSRLSIRSLFFFRLITSSAAWGGAFCAALLVDDYRVREFVGFLGLLKLAESLCDLSYGALQRLSRNVAIALSMGMRGALLFALTTGALIVFGSIDLGIVVAAFTTLLVFLLHDLRRVLELVDSGLIVGVRNDDFAASTQLSIAKTILPLALVICVNTVSVNAPRYALAASAGLEEVGFFSAILYIGVTLNLGTAALCSVALPNLASSLAISIKAFRRLLWTSIFYIVLAATFFVGVSALFGEEILRLLYTYAYGEYHIELVIICISVGLSAISSIMGTAITAARSYWPQFIGSVVFLVSAYVFAEVGVAAYGLRGAVVAYCLTWLVKIAVNAVILRSLVRVHTVG